MTGFALGVMAGVLFAGFGALFGDSGQQEGILCGKAVGRIAQCQHLVDGFGAGFHGLVTGGKLVDTVAEADTTGSNTGGGGLEQVFVGLVSLLPETTIFIKMQVSVDVFPPFP